VIEAPGPSAAAVPYDILIAGGLDVWARIRVFGAMLTRDLYVLRHSWKYVLLRVVMQPLLFIFIFARVFPLVGQGIGGVAGSSNFSTLLVPGTLAMTVFLNGIQAVTIPLISDLGMTHEIEDRVLAPLPLGWIVGEKIVGGAIEGCVSGLIVIPCAVFIPSTRIDLNITWYAAVPAVLLVALTGSALGLYLGVRVPIAQVQTMFAILILPITFLGATYYPWLSLTRAEWLKWAIVVNPLVYANETLRGFIAPSIPHMPEWVSLPVLGLFFIVFSAAGANGIRKRLVT
jgi:ABC-2 type transport system permease protein